MKWGNGQTVPCETIKNSVLYMETRDKLFTEEQYRKQLAGYSKRCKQLESSIMEIINAEKEHIQLYSAPNSNVAYNKTVTLFGCKLNSFLTKYSVGEDMEVLKYDYNDLLETLTNHWTITGMYVQMLWMLSIGIMLDTDEQNIRILSGMIDNENVNDALYDFLIKYRLTDWERCSNTVLFPVPYQSALSIISSNNQSKELSIQKLEKYLKKEWYQGHSDCAWHDDHKYGIRHDGYWSFESGALVKILGLDDSSLKGLPYYPYDMVHWNENKI